MKVLVQHKKTGKRFLLLPCDRWWVKLDGEIAGRIGRRLRRYTVIKIFYKKVSHDKD